MKQGRRTVTAAALACLTLGALAASALAGSGSLDHGFSHDGKITYNGKPARDAAFVHGMAAEPDGGYVMVGEAEDDTDLVVARFDPDGSPDDAFGDHGFAYLHFDDTDDVWGSGVVVQPDGSIVIGGYVDSRDFEPGHPHFAIARYLPNGQLDHSFGHDGVVRIDVGRQIVFREPVDVALQPDGKILASGAVGVGHGHARGTALLVARLKTGGSLDKSFSKDGLVHIRYGKGEADGGSLALRRNGRIVVAGTVEAPGGGPYRMTVASLRPSGHRDKSFSHDGRTRVAFGSGDAGVGDATVLHNGDILLAGDSASARHSFMAAAELRPNGSLDHRFSHDGRQAVRVGFGANAEALAVQRNGRILLGGVTFHKSDRSPAEAALARLRKHGAIDSSFSRDGSVRISFAQGRQQLGDSIDGLTIQPSGRIVAAVTVNPKGFQLRWGAAGFHP